MQASVARSDGSYPELRQTVKVSVVENVEDTLRAKLVCDLLNAFRAFSGEAGKLRLQFLRAKEPMSLESYGAFHKQLIAEEKAFERYLKLRAELVITHLKNDPAKPTPVRTLLASARRTNCA